MQTLLTFFSTMFETHIQKNCKVKQIIYDIINFYFKLSGTFPIFFFYQGFLRRHWWFTRQQGKGGDHPLSHSTTSTRSRTLRHLFATFHVRWLSRIFNRNACVYQTATRSDWPTDQITIWVIDWWCNVCLFTWWVDTRFLLQQFDIGNRWIWTRIDYHPCITSEPINQANRLHQLSLHKRTA